MVDLVRLVAEAARIVGRDEQPVEHGGRVDGAVVGVAVGEERVGEVQQGLQAEFRGRLVLGDRQQALHQQQQLAGAFEPAAELQEMPASVVRHRLEREALQGAEVLAEPRAGDGVARLAALAQVADHLPGLVRQVGLERFEQADEVRHRGREARRLRGIISRAARQQRELVDRVRFHGRHVLHLENQRERVARYLRIEQRNLVVQQRVEFLEAAGEGAGALEVAAEPEEIVGRAARGGGGMAERLGRPRADELRRIRGLALVEHPGVFAHTALLE